MARLQSITSATAHLFGAGALFCSLVLLATHTAPAAPTNSDLFPQQQLVTLHITIPAQGTASLDKDPRTDVAAVVQEGTQTWTNVLLHLKGSTGSFRKLSDKPAVTLNFGPGAFHGLDKVHLNNSVEDPSYLNEYLGSELFRAAGVPAARVAHAMLELNGRRLGLYVLVEGFGESFLSGYFTKPTGYLFEPGQGHDVNENLHMSPVGGPAGPAALQSLIAACLERDLGKRWQQLQAKLDTDRFLSFIALEVLLNHRDGYCLAKNNFRIYQDLKSGKILFFPHGMDQLFGKPDASLLPGMSGLVAKSMMEIPESRQLYKQRLQAIATNILHMKELKKTIQQKSALLAPALSRQERRDFEKEAEALQTRIMQRQDGIQRQFTQWKAEQPRFVQGRTSLTNWLPLALGNKGKLSHDRAETPLLHILAEPGSAAAWRTKLSLPKGRYTFSAMARTDAVSIKRVARNPGARLRIPGSALERSASLLGNQPWTRLSLPFEVTDPERSLEFVCELAADGGEAFFREDSLLVEQLQ